VGVLKLVEFVLASLTNTVTKKRKEVEQTERKGKKN